jgi:hypothetical protein
MDRRCQIMSIEFESEDLSAGGHHERRKMGQSVDVKLERIRGGNGRSRKSWDSGSARVEKQRKAEEDGSDGEAS